MFYNYYASISNLATGSYFSLRVMAKIELALGIQEFHKETSKNVFITKKASFGGVLQLIIYP